MGKACVVLWLFALWGCLVNRWRTPVTVTIAFVVVFLSVCPLKYAVNRRRPTAASVASGGAADVARKDPAGRFSFPSGDTAVAFAAAGVLIAALPVGWAPVLVLTAGAVGLLRIASLSHYPSDVLVGAAIGVLAARLALWITRRPAWWKPEWLSPRRLHLLRLLMGLALLVGPLLFWESMWPFLKVYGIPTLALMLAYVAVAQRPVLRSLGFLRFLDRPAFLEELGGEPAKQGPDEPETPAR